MIIYKATNLDNGKVYIGKTKNSIEDRIKQHNKSNHIYLFQRALKKYGPENFDWQIIDVLEDEEELSRREIYWINLYGSNHNKLGYNLTNGGEGVLNPSINVRKKMSINQKGTLNSNFKHGKFSGPHFCIKCNKKLAVNTATLCKSCCRKGIKFTNSHRNRISISKIGDKNPAKQSWVKKKISKTVKELWNKGIYDKKKRKL
jgi:group I intron endonuclease